MVSNHLRERRQLHGANHSFAISLLLKEAQGNPRVLWDIFMLQAWAISTQFFATNVHMQADTLKLFSQIPRRGGSNTLTTETLSGDRTTHVDSDHHNLEKITESQYDSEKAKSDVWLHS